MNAQLASAALTILSVALYQTLMKTIPTNINPLFALVTFYVTALLCTLVVMKFAPIEAPAWSLSDISWPVIGAGIAIVGIELGFLLMYRSGWHLATAPLIVTGGVAILLAPVALMVFRQPMTLRYGLGMALCLGGLYLLTPQRG